MNDSRLHGRDAMEGGQHRNSTPMSFSFGPVPLASAAGEHRYEASTGYTAPMSEMEEGKRDIIDDAISTWR